MSGTLDWTHADWDSTARYSLTIDIVNTYLKSLFGNWNFYTQFSDSDTIKYWVPRKLSDVEKNELKAKGYF
ncbi:hypothetical protein ACEPPN_015710 [Leptodophora sp. 'Broadleaf-Isolate-01']